MTENQEETQEVEQQNAEVSQFGLDLGEMFDFNVEDVFDTSYWN